MTVHVSSINFVPLDTTVCGQFEWYGNVYTHSGNYTHTLQNAHGCDSILFLQATVVPPPQVHYDTTVCSDDMPVVWHGMA